MHLQTKGLSNSAPAKLQCVNGFYRAAIVVALSCLMSLSCSNAAIAEDSLELRPTPEAVTAPLPGAAPVVVQPQQKPSNMQRLLFPVNHPIAATEKLIFPVQHPIKATLCLFNGFCRVGKWSEQKGLTAGLSLVGALGNVATPAMIGVLK